MASEITEQEDENPFCIHGDKEAEKMRIRQIIGYQKSLYLSSASTSSSPSCSSSSCSSFSSAVPWGSSTTSPGKSISLLELMRGGSASLGRLFDMEHTSLGNYLKDYSVSPIIKPLLLWGSDTDDDDDRIRDDPWKEMARIGGAFALRFGNHDGDGFVQEDCEGKKTHSRKRKLIRTKSYRRLPRFGLWRCGGSRFRFRLRFIRKLRVLIKGRRIKVMK